MLGAIAGDIIGSVYEARPIKTVDFPLFQHKCRFTDDTVLTVATADAIINGLSYKELLKQYYKNYQVGYGPLFHQWAISDDLQPYNSYGNGSAMRVSPIGFACRNLEECLDWAKRSAEVTHNHPEGIKGAQATASAIFLARTGNTREQIKNYIESKFNYNLNKTLDEIRPSYKFEVSCQESVPQSIQAFLESSDFEHAIRLSISLGGDSDTMACITGGIAQAFYGGVPGYISGIIYMFIDNKLKEVTTSFMESYCGQH